MRIELGDQFSELLIIERRDLIQNRPRSALIKVVSIAFKTLIVGNRNQLHDTRTRQIDVLRNGFEGIRLLGETLLRFTQNARDDLPALVAVLHLFPNAISKLVNGGRGNKLRHIHIHFHWSMFRSEHQVWNTGRKLVSHSVFPLYPKAARISVLHGLLTWIRYAKKCKKDPDSREK